MNELASEHGLKGGECKRRDVPRSRDSKARSLERVIVEKPAKPTLIGLFALTPRAGDAGDASRPFERSNGSRDELARIERDRRSAARCGRYPTQFDRRSCSAARDRACCRTSRRSCSARTRLCPACACDEAICCIARALHVRRFDPVVGLAPLVDAVHAVEVVADRVDRRSLRLGRIGGVDACVARLVAVRRRLRKCRRSSPHRRRGRSAPSARRPVRCSGARPAPRRSRPRTRCGRRRPAGIDAVDEGGAGVERARRRGEVGRERDDRDSSSSASRSCRRSGVDGGEHWAFRVVPVDGGSTASPT